jgi:Fibronectin type III domain
LRITGVPPDAAAVGVAYYFNAQVTGTARGVVTHAIQNKPNWATFDTLTGELKGTPTAVGTFVNITINASDGYNTATMAPFSIQVVDKPLRVTVTWAAPTQNVDGSALNNLAGFVIHYGTSPTALDKVAQIASSNARSYLFTDLSRGTTYYFAVAAVNDMNVEGSLSPVTPLAL